MARLPSHWATWRIHNFWDETQTDMQTTVEVSSGGIARSYGHFLLSAQLIISAESADVRPAECIMYWGIACAPAGLMQLETMSSNSDYWLTTGVEHVTTGFELAGEPMPGSLRATQASTAFSAEIHTMRLHTTWGRPRIYMLPEIYGDPGAKLRVDVRAVSRVLEFGFPG